MRPGRGGGGGMLPMMPTVGQTSPRSLPQPTAGTWVTWHPPTAGLLSPLADSVAHLKDDHVPSCACGISPCLC